MKLSELEPGLIEVGYINGGIFRSEGDHDRIYFFAHNFRSPLLIHEDSFGNVFMHERIKTAKDILCYRPGEKVKEMNS